MRGVSRTLAGFFAQLSRFPTLKSKSGFGFRPYDQE